MRARLSAAAVLLLSAAACHHATAPVTVAGSITSHRAAWRKLNYTDYSFTYQFSSNIQNANQPIRIVVAADTVSSATLIATGDSLGIAGFYTIDGLFDLALAASQDGTLQSITFDATNDYPTSIAVFGNPDAFSGAQASDLQRLP